MFRLVGSIFPVLALVVAMAVADEWPQWRGPNRDGVWRETGIIKKFASDKLTPVWRTEIGAGYSGPSVAGGRVYLTDRLVQPQQRERIQCLDAKTGDKKWEYAYPCVYGIDYTAGPRANVTVDGDRAYALGAMGHLHCLACDSGKVLWMHDCNQEYDIRMPVWGISAAPLVFQDLVIVEIGGKDATVVAFNKLDGKEVWRALKDRAQYSAPILVQQAGKPVCVCWTGDAVVGLDPATGKTYWREDLKPRNMPIGVASPVVNGDRLFLTSFYDGSLMLRLNQDQVTVERLWRRIGTSEQDTDALHSIISTPVFRGDYIYGVDSYGQLRCLSAANGDRLWENLSATPKDRWSTIHFVEHEGETWMFNERGELIIAKLSAEGYEEISRAKLIEPTQPQLPRRRGGVSWSHPAFAYGHVFARSDTEIVCVSLLTADQPRK